MKYLLLLLMSSNFACASVPSTCPIGYTTPSPAVCQWVEVPCSVPNGTGMVIEGGACQLRSCVAGYHIDGAMCTVDGISTLAALTAALAKAKGGEVFTLANVSFGFLVLSNKFTSPVMIKGGKFDGMWLDGAQNLIIDGATVKGTGKPHGADTKTQFHLVHLNNTKNVTFQNSTVTDAPANVGRGISIASALNASAIGNTISGFDLGVSSHFSTNTVIKGNHFVHMTGDGITFGESTKMLIEANTFDDTNRDAGRKHVDCIQGNNGVETGDRTSPQSTDVTIRGNIITTTDQGIHEIYMGNGEARAYGASEFYKNVLIENNVIKGAMKLGIGIGETDGLVIRNNTCIRNPALPKTTSDIGIPNIIVAQRAVNVTITGNTLTKAPVGGGDSDWNNVPLPASWIVNGNVIQK